MNSIKIVSIILVVLVAIGGIIIFKSPESSVSNVSGVSKPYVEIVNPSGFVNTDGITLKELVGKKVILVDFLTYSCINCQRTFPYLNAWYEKYKDRGLEVVGIHTPEFAFEKDINNVREAAKEFSLEFPMVLDNDYSTWRAYENSYWPRKYLIDINGNIVYDHIGEGKYEETEEKIKELLKERAEKLGTEDAIDSTLVSSEMPEINIEARSPETYFGSGRNEYLANGQPGVSGFQDLSLPDIFIQNALYLGGKWTFAGEYAEAKGGSKVVYKFNAKNVFLVAEALNGGEVKVFVDGETPSTIKGSDVSVDGKVGIKNSKLYKIIEGTKAEAHTLELEVGEGVRLYTFTFG